MKKNSLPFVYLLPHLKRRGYKKNIIDMRLNGAVWSSTENLLPHLKGGLTKRIYMKSGFTEFHGEIDVESQGRNHGDL